MSKNCLWCDLDDDTSIPDDCVCLKDCGSRICNFDGSLGVK